MRKHTERDHGNEDREDIVQWIHSVNGSVGHVLGLVLDHAEGVDGEMRDPIVRTDKRHPDFQAIDEWGGYGQCTRGPKTNRGRPRNTPSYLEIS